jgi:mycoredoxin
MDNEVQTPVTVMWRPGCPWCMLLRRGLRKAGVATTEINIWEDPDAAARVRKVAGGNEVVPTVFVGDEALVNPSAREVAALARRVAAG